MWVTANKVRVGLNVSWTDIGPGTTQANVHADWYVQSAAWGMNDNMWLDVSGSRAGNHNFTLSSGTGQTVTQHVAHYEINNQGLSYAGGPTYTFIGQITSSEWGNPRLEYSWTLPPKQADVPGQPPITHDSLTSTSVRIVVAPADPRGATVDAYETYILSNNAWPGGGGNVVHSAGGGTTSKGGLTRGTRYYYTARAHNAAGWGAFADMQAFSTLPTIPVVGTGYSMRSITRQSATTTGISVTDTGGGTLDNARVQHNTTASETGATITTRGSWGDVTVTGLTEETLYHFRVSVRNAAGWSAWGPWKTFTTLADAPDDMAAPTFSAITDTSLTATWAAPAMNGAEFISYRWEVSLSESFASVIQSGTTTTPSISLTELTPGTRYFARMRANATPNNGGYGSSSAKTTGIAPNSGLRAYATIGGVVRTGTLYACIGGTVREIRPMVKLMGNLETE